MFAVAPSGGAGGALRVVIAHFRDGCSMYLCSRSVFLLV